MTKKKTQPKNKGGRPTKYTKALGKRICDRIASGKSLRKIVEDKKMPCRKTIHLWLLDEEKKEFLHQYEIACNIRAENMFDGLEEIADTSDKKESTNRSRLRVDTRKWYLSKIMPKKFGDKMDLTTLGEKISPLTKEAKGMTREQIDEYLGKKLDKST